MIKNPLIIIIYNFTSNEKLNVSSVTKDTYYHLIKILNENRRNNTLIIVDDDINSSLDTHQKYLKNIKVCTQSQLNLSALQVADVLIIDSRSWFNFDAVDKIFECILNLKTSFKFCESISAILQSYRQPLTMALFLKANEISSFLYKKTIKNHVYEHLDDVININNLKDISKIYSDDLSGSLLLVSCIDFAEVERKLSKKRVFNAMLSGLRVKDPPTFYIRGQLAHGKGVEIDSNVIIEGDVTLGDNVKIHANCILKDCKVGDNTIIKPFSLIEQSSLGSDSFIGPYGRIRPGCIIGNNAQIGNYVEIKNSHIGIGVRINHHAFIGDAQLADHVTIGAGTITCNHDGTTIRKTVIEQGAYIGSGCNLVAPLNIGAGATIGAGSTIIHDAPAAKLTLARSIQRTINRWMRPTNQGEVK